MRLYLLTICCVIFSFANAADPTYYELRVYNFKDTAQEAVIDRYLAKAFMPALHRSGIKKIGVFKALANDTAAEKRIYILIPLVSPGQLAILSKRLMNDAVYQRAAKEFIDAGYNNPPYSRLESILMRAFSMAPALQLPALKGPYKDRLYELRSYESSTEKLAVNKVHMFNEGGEIDLFRRLGFNAIFYASVITGSKMPNLMYMTSFENKADRDAHWKNFGSHPDWKALSAKSEYQHNVSHIDVIFLRPADYSDY
ncbi:MAG: NIPSNAP family protein [Chitinophagaceae bacterium]|nr:NIPSNAP family protein [Chitinophagaceae bacterium]